MCVSSLTEPMGVSLLVGMQDPKSYCAVTKGSCFLTEPMFVSCFTEPMGVSFLVGMQDPKSYCAATKD
jgi:hypothetical protein